ncbi:MAG: hypothetical protein N2205_02785 [Candidatus Caldatribacterium sp.]|uniref:hypothetical protein n=1 Tax=Candidatus Caldatribacterium sp. TaxID=2282143 RepID=UPI00299C2E31|nr:hypothetical protein [Candidatus Caldatribacterium sp.]MCX7730132.1 hypothetical protein [Candidatus Caldatribacterium sp.]MDW8081487.1 hypothetical protein [Candidatus Calescibacterium sp.]
MEERRETIRDVFEEFIFGPLGRVLDPFLGEEARQHLTKARVEILKAIRAFIDAEIERIEKGKRQE